MRRGAGLMVAGSVGALLAVDGTRAQGQGEAPPPSNVPPAPRSLIVRIHSYPPGSAVVHVGSGIVVGLHNDSLYVATAMHVVSRETVAADTTVTQDADSVHVWLETARDRRLHAAVARRSPNVQELDLAVITVPVDQPTATMFGDRLDRRGEATTLRSGDQVIPVGCPDDRCWDAPSPAPRVLVANAVQIDFQSSFVEGGSSGGAIFDRSWEVVGLVTDTDAPIVHAIPIELVMGQLADWGVPVGLRRPSVPRNGYRITVGLALFAPLAGDDILSPAGLPLDAHLDSRLPSGRLTVTRQLTPLLGWHAGGLRLAPKNLAVTAAIGGAGMAFRKGRLMARPFLELALARVEGRTDAGGFTVVDGDESQYMPVWQRGEGAELGLGGGLGIEAMLAPHVILELLVASWTINTPENAPDLPGMFLGAGVRWGM